ncbi:MAG: hypothetical protein HY825_13600 [Acidobacteria bacterium]|nr:hypothetical protein [Acidobacteriota bacterium]
MNPLIPTAQITLPGEETPRTLRLTMRALATFDKLTGRNLLMESLEFRKLTFNDALALLWATMSHDPKAPSIDELGDMLPPSFAMIAFPVLIGLIGASFPQPEPGEAAAQSEGAAPAGPFSEAAPSGSDSGPLGVPS